MSIIIKDVAKNFGSFQALSDINLEVKDGKLVALLGPSGSGKSTLLRTIAGLEAPDRGQVFINGQDATHVDIRKRNIGFVFQHYALFKHLTIRQNIAFGLEIRKQPARLIQNRVEELLALVQLEGLGNRYPSQLSGGQRQRVALARALAVQPQVLLLDEPFGALDAKVRKELRAWLRRLHDEVHLTSVFVTHDQEEAMEVADEIVVMNQGKIEQIGAPADIYDHPATPFVMSFIGEVNVLPVSTTLFNNNEVNDLPVSTTLLNNNDMFSSQDISVFIRPHDFDLYREGNGNTSEATVKRITHLGWEIQVELLLLDQTSVIVHLGREQFFRLNPKLNQTVYIKPREAKVFAYDYQI
ncbi:MAG: sulfate/molybdate ABC transporter ATP-binding protein [Cyanobacteriota bacterium]|nr:sulfate/molybdate ABC transporter ATP-binding protein [Cyanobacteriota bacterium]